MDSLARAEEGENRFAQNKGDMKSLSWSTGLRLPLI